MAGTLGELWKVGSTAPIQGDIPQGGLAIDVVGKRAYSADSTGAIFQLSAAEIADIDGLQDALDGKENSLGNPDILGKYLTSTVGGVRSWEFIPEGVTDHTELTSIGTNTHAQIDTHVGSTANPHGVTTEQIGAAEDVHDHLWADITDPPATYPPSAHDHNSLYYQKTEFIDETAGAADAGKPILLDEQGLIPDSMLNTKVFKYMGGYTPLGGDEYPVPPYAAGDMWSIEGLGVDVGYTYLTGDLTGKVVYDGDYIAYSATNGWSILTGAGVDVADFYHLDGSYAITADFKGGGHKIINIAPATVAGDGVELVQMNTALDLKADLASPQFTGVPIAPTATQGTNTTQLATTAFVMANKGTGTVTNVTGVAPVVSSGGATPAISMANSSASVDGYLSATNFALFAAKIDQADLNTAFELGAY